MSMSSAVYLGEHWSIHHNEAENEEFVFYDDDMEIVERASVEAGPGDITVLRGHHQNSWTIAH